MARLSRQNTDFLVGLFVLFALIGVVFIALRAANIADGFVEDSYEIRVQFDNVGGLSKRAVVKSSGVRVGTVSDVVFNNDDYVADVYLAIDNQYQFPVDSIFSIVSSNLLGGQYIAIEIGGEEDYFVGGEITQGNSAIVLESLISKFLFDKAGE